MSTTEGSWLAVPPGEHTLTIHAGPQAAAHSVSASAPLQPGVPINVAAGQRAFLFIYVTPGSPELNTLILPFTP